MSHFKGYLPQNNFFIQQNIPFALSRIQSVYSLQSPIHMPFVNGALCSHKVGDNLNGVLFTRCLPSGPHQSLVNHMKWTNEKATATCKSWKPLLFFKETDSKMRHIWTFVNPAGPHGGLNVITFITSLKRYHIQVDEIMH